MTATATRSQSTDSIRWTRVQGTLSRATSYEAEVDGKRYKMAKQNNFGNQGKYYMWVYVPENEGTDRLLWDLVKPHNYLYDFGSTLKDARHNAVLFLKRGIDGDSPEWRD
jgi:hypothetical protein